MRSPHLAVLLAACAASSCTLVNTDDLFINRASVFAAQAPGGDLPDSTPTTVTAGASSSSSTTGEGGGGASSSTGEGGQGGAASTTGTGGTGGAPTCFKCMAALDKWDGGPTWEFCPGSEDLYIAVFNAACTVPACASTCWSFCNLAEKHSMMCRECLSLNSEAWHDCAAD